MLWILDRLFEQSLINATGFVEILNQFDKDPTVRLIVSETKCLRTSGIE